MKVCVIGSGYLGLKMAKSLYDLGAHVSVFHRTQPGGLATEMKNYITDPELLRDWEHQIPSDFDELLAWTEESRVLRAGDVQRVHKRIFEKVDQPSSRSRMSDLFRVVFKAEFSQEMKEQWEQNPEVLNKLDEHTLKALEGVLENFDDFDIVINASGKRQKTRMAGPIGVSALNENRVPVEYGLHSLFTNDLKNHEHHILIVGSGVNAALALLKLHPWLKLNPARKCYIVTSEYPPFKTLENEWPMLSQKVESVINLYFADWQNDNERYRSEIHQWRALEEHIRAKTPAPKEPSSQLMIYPGHHVLAFDRLSDREGFFATIESLENLESLTTLAVDKVFCMTGHEINNEIDHGLRVLRNWNNDHRTRAIQDEPGYYQLSQADQILEIQNDILNFFSKAEES